MKSIVLCGSQRYKNEIKDFAGKLRKFGAPSFLNRILNGKEKKC